MAVDEQAVGTDPGRAFSPARDAVAASRGRRALRLRLSRLLCGIVVVLASAASLALKGGVPTSLNLSPYDGLLFARNARSLADGHWLGHFTDLTLVKGIGYPGLIAIAHEAGAELALVEQAIYLVAALTTAAFVLVVTRRRWLASACFAVLALGPANFGSASNDIVRDNLYASLALLFVVSAALLAVLVVRCRAAGWIAACAALCGLSGAWAWVTREEGLSLLPPVLVVAAGTAFSAWRSRTAERPRGWSRASTRAAGRPVLAVLVAGIAFGTPLIVVASINGDRYGASLTNDMSQGTFLRAYADWTRVTVPDEQARVPINAAQRQAVYRVSPAARELAASLERPDNLWRTGATCGRPVCDYGGAWMVWALRDATADAGHFDTARAAQDYFTELSDEINGACDRGELTCRPRLPASLQPLQQAPLEDLAHSFGGMVGDLLVSRGLFEPVQARTVTPPRTRDEYTAVINGLPENADAARREATRYERRLWVYDSLSAGYRVAIPVLLGVALLGGVLCAVLARGRAASARRSVVPLAVLAAALGVGVVVRLMLLAIVDVAEFDSANGRYQLTNHVFLLAAVTVGSAAVVAAVSEGRSVRRTVRRVDHADREADDGDLRATDDQDHPQDR